MARPRVFISSTYFDLKVVRNDIERFIKEIGYEPVLFERGHVPYGKDEPLENDCYREITSCDIIITIIGGKYGTASKDQKHSITQRELKTAIDNGKQIYVFVENAVLNEYQTYQANKDVKGFKPVSVNDTKVFSFVEEIYGLEGGNPIKSFELSENIVHFLREQWAGLFQRLLQESGRQKEVDIIENLKNTADTLKQLVTTVMSETKSKGHETIIKDILLSSHPAFAAIKNAANIPYRVAFHNFKELNTLLSARQFIRDETPEVADCFEWDSKDKTHGVRVSQSLFGKDGKLIVFTPQDWDKNLIVKYTSTPDDAPPKEVPLA